MRDGKLPFLRDFKVRLTSEARPLPTGVELNATFIGDLVRDILCKATLPILALRMKSGVPGLATFRPYLVADTYHNMSTFRVV